VVTSFILYN